MAVGHEGTGADSFNPRFWFATKPGAWQRASGPGYQQWVSAEVVCPLGDRWVAFGAVVTGDETQATAWTSRDGRAWTESAPPGTFHPDGSAIYDCTPGAGSVVVVGQVSGRQSNPAVWITKDGRRFRRIEDPDLIIGANGGCSESIPTRKVGSTRWAPPRWTVPPGRSSTAAGPAAQAWQATQLPDEVFLAPEGQQSVNDIAVFQGRIVIVGQYLGQAGFWSAALPR